MEVMELRKKSPSELKKELGLCKAFLSHRMQISMQQSNNTAKLKELSEALPELEQYYVSNLQLTKTKEGNLT